MAIGIYFPSSGMNSEKYDQCIKALRKAGAGHPPGRLYHACFGPKEDLMVFDVWTSQAAFEKFGRTLGPIMSELGLTAKPTIMPVHKTIVPAGRPAPARKKAKSGARKKR